MKVTVFIITTLFITLIILFFSTINIEGNISKESEKHLRTVTTRIAFTVIAIVSFLLGLFINN